MGGHDGMRRSQSAEGWRGMRLVADSDLLKGRGEGPREVRVVVE